MKLLSEEDRSSIEAHLERIARERLCATGLDAVRDVICRYVMAGGKRIRPQLTAWTYQQARGRAALTTPLLDVAAAWELFHAFLLVHDDIIDESDTRRDQDALHVQLAALDSRCPRFGRNLAIVAGDLLHTAAMGVIHDLDLEPRSHRDLLRLFSRIASTTGFGQAIDICMSHVPMDQVDQETLLREYHWKTAAYTFEGPMVSGALLAGMDDAACAALSTFALSIGQAYQLQNDLLDLNRPADEGCDLVQGKRTLTLLQHRSSLDRADRPRFDERLASIGSGSEGAIDRAETLRGEMIASGALRRTSAIIDDLLDAARSARSDPALPPSLSAGLGNLLDALAASYFVDV